MSLSDRISAIAAEITRASAEELRGTVSPLITLLMQVGRRLGVDGILRHYKWREVMLAARLNHVVNARTSTGRGGDATDSTSTTCEYKSSKISRAQLDRQIRNGEIAISLVYNGAYGEDRIQPYLSQRHFFGLFDDETEQFILAVEVAASLVVDQLLINDRSRRPGQTTNLNTVKTRFPDKDGNVTLLDISDNFLSLVNESGTPDLRKAVRATRT